MNEQSINRPKYEKRFEAEGDQFEAFNNARAWLMARGFSVGKLQHDEFVPAHFGEAELGRWRDMDGEERQDLHVTIYPTQGSMRRGPVAVYLRPNAPSAVIEAFTSAPPDPDKAAQVAVEGVGA